MQRAALLIACSCVLLATTAGHAAEVYVDPPTSRVDDIHCASSSLGVRLAVRGEVVGMQGFSIALGFDPAILAPRAVTRGAVLDDQPAPVFFFPWEARFAEGIVQVDAAVLGTTCDVPSPDGGTTLFEIEFDKLGCFGHGECATDLTIELVDVRDGSNQRLALAAADGYVDILPCILPLEIISWGRIKALHRD